MYSFTSEWSHVHANQCLPHTCRVWTMERGRDPSSPFLWSSPSTIRDVSCSGSSLHLGYFCWIVMVWASLWHMTMQECGSVYQASQAFQCWAVELTGPQWILSEAHASSWRGWGSELIPLARGNAASPWEIWERGALLGWCRPSP